MFRTRLLAVALPLTLAACAAPEAPSHEEPALDETRLSPVTFADREALLGDGFAIVKEESDLLGLRHVRVIQQVSGIVVLGGDAIVHFDGAGSVYAVTGMHVPQVQVDVVPSITAPQAKEAVRASLAERRLDFRAKARTAEDLSEPTLAIVPAPTGDMLVWMSSTLLDDEIEPVQLEAMVDAHTGAIVQLRDVLETGKPAPGGGTTETFTPAVGTGATLYSGTVSLSTASSSAGGYRLYDIGRNARTTDMALRTNGTGRLFSDADNVWDSAVQSAGADASYGTGRTLDYFLTVHGRNGIDGQGNATLASSTLDGYALSRVHYGRRYNNAFWSDSCGCMTYGDGDGVVFNPLVSLDVTGHEMSHGVTSRTAALTYSGESGGLNEASSDIFGAAVEFYANNSNDPGDWLIGEEFDLRARGYLRSMSNPRIDGQSIDHYSQYYSGLDVHYSSGLGNHFFYLLSDGGTNATSGLSVAGIGLSKAEKIWFRALTIYMTSGTNFAQARAATLNAAADLYGPGAERDTVAAAWTACGVN